MALVLAACSAGQPALDAGPYRDASLLDGAIVIEDGGSAPDASATPDAGAPLCPPGDCDPTRVGSCPEGSGSCVLYGAAPSCALDVGTVRTGYSCESNLDCAPSLACFIAGTSVTTGVCARVCCVGDDSVCDPGQRCAGSGLLLAGTLTPWGRCLETRACDVLSPTTCEPREGCYIVDATGRTECRVAGAAQAGESCVLPEDCAPGLFCGGLTTRQCIQICRIGQGECPTMQRCVAQAHSPSGTGFCTTETLRP